MEGIGIALIVGLVMGWMTVAIAWKRSEAKTEDGEELSAAYSLGCKDCRCRRMAE